MEELYQALNRNGLLFKQEVEGKEVWFIHLETDEMGTNVSIDMETFELLFVNVKESPTYENLCETHYFIMNDVTYTMTAEEMGYKKYFDLWREKGIIK